MSTLRRFTIGIFAFFGILSTHYYYQNLAVKVPEIVDQENCHKLIREAKDLLRENNQSYSCSAMEEEGCEETFQVISSMATPESVYNRSLSCQLDWPEYSQVTQEETDFPLAYFMTVYTDARTLELTLATIFRPHNSYCLHIDKKAEEEFKRTVLQIINCYRAKVELRVER